MTVFAPVSGLVGGVLIGLSAVILMLAIGRIAGVCGIVVNAMTVPELTARSWRLVFMAGLPLTHVVYGLGYLLGALRVRTSKDSPGA